MTRRHHPSHARAPRPRSTTLPRHQTADWAAALLSLVFLSAPLTAQQPGATFEPEFALTSSPEAPVLELSYDLPALAEADPGPFLTIFGSGRYVVHRPFYMKNAGDWVGQLERRELEELFGSIVSAGLLDVDYGRFAEQLEERRSLAAKAAGEGGEIRLVSERETTIIRVRLERYKPEGVLGVPGQPLDKVLHVSNLAFALEENPGLETLRSLSSISSRLRALSDRPDLERLEPTDGAAPLR